MIAGLVNRGMTETDAKIKAKLTIESVINALKEGTINNLKTLCANRN